MALKTKTKPAKMASTSYISCPPLQSILRNASVLSETVVLAVAKEQMILSIRHARTPLTLDFSREDRGPAIRVPRVQGSTTRRQIGRRPSSPGLGAEASPAQQASHSPFARDDNGRGQPLHEVSRRR
jgi:hypothetical protein